MHTADMRTLWGFSGCPDTADSRSAMLSVTPVRTRLKVEGLLVHFLRREGRSKQPILRLGEGGAGPSVADCAADSGAQGYVVEREVMQEEEAADDEDGGFLQRQRLHHPLCCAGFMDALDAVSVSMGTARSNRCSSGASAGRRSRAGVCTNVGSSRINNDLWTQATCLILTRYAYTGTSTEQ